MCLQFVPSSRDWLLSPSNPHDIRIVLEEFSSYVNFPEPNWAARFAIVGAFILPLDESSHHILIHHSAAFTRITDIPEAETEELFAAVNYCVVPDCAPGAGPKRYGQVESAIKRPVPSEWQIMCFAPSQAKRVGPGPDADFEEFEESPSLRRAIQRAIQAIERASEEHSQHLRDAIALNPESRDPRGSIDGLDRPSIELGNKRSPLAVLPARPETLSPPGFWEWPDDGEPDPSCANEAPISPQPPPDPAVNRVTAASTECDGSSLNLPAPFTVDSDVDEQAVDSSEEEEDAREGGDGSGPLDVNGNPLLEDDNGPIRYWFD
jgi:hypothetical protein